MLPLLPLQPKAPGKELRKVMFTTNTAKRSGQGRALRTCKGCSSVVTITAAEDAGCG